jgi:hypothetical protein
MFVLSLILVGILLRFMPHPANFTPVAAIALFSGAYLKRRYAIFVPLILMVLSDVFIGMHNVLVFTWGCFVLSALLGRSLYKHIGILSVAGISILSSLVFYIVTNFGVWAMGWYPQNLKGLIDSYILALPFLRDFTISTLIYSAVFFTTYEYITLKVKEKKLAKVLL